MWFYMGKIRRVNSAYYAECSHKIFQLDYSYNACKPGVKQQIADMIQNALGTRDTARILGVSKDIVTAVLKTEKFPQQTNEKYLRELDSRGSADIDIEPVISAEMDEMRSFYNGKAHQIWLWWAADHANNTPLAYRFGTREHKYLDELLELLKPFN
jgi:hypothetical protein